MKFLISIIFLICTTSMTAQNLNYKNGLVVNNDEIIDAAEITLTPNKDLVKSAFNDWLQDTYNIGLSKKKLLFFNKSFMTAKGETIPEFDNRHLDLYVKVVDSEDSKSKLLLVGAFGYEEWITKSDYPTEYGVLDNMLMSFVKSYLPEYYQEMVINDAEEVEQIKDKIDDMTENISDNKDDITDLEKENIDLKHKLKNNEEKLLAAKKKLEATTTKHKSIKKKMNNLDSTKDQNSIDKEKIKKK